MSDVPRETAPVPPPPAGSGDFFAPGRLDLARRYADLLGGPGVVRGLIGPREGPRLWERHLLNCAALAEWLPGDARVCDVGSGAGLPGLVLAIARPDLRIVLVEPLLRRTTFLEEVVDDLALDNVEVVRGKAEALHGARRFDVVTSRAVAPLGRLLDWSMPLVDPTGALIAMKGSTVQEEIADAQGVLRRWGCSEPEVRVLGSTVLPVPTVAVRVSWADPRAVSSAAAEGPPRAARTPRSKRRQVGRPDRPPRSS